MTFPVLIALIFQLQHLDKPTTCFWKAKQKHTAWFFSWFHLFISWSFALTHRQNSLFSLYPSLFLHRTARLVVNSNLSETYHPQGGCSGSLCLHSLPLPPTSGYENQKNLVKQKWGQQQRLDSGKWICVSSLEPTEVFETLDARQFLPTKVMAEGVTRRQLEDFEGFLLSGRHPYASDPSTGIDRQQFCACSYPFGISVGLKSASTIKEPGENASHAVSEDV